ncbi:uncharacterized protein LOC111687252 [Lucilia cuprina]|uniref:uncharacterized protein LOC111687252 n=1 Tax=Lucilia cuprina TaxID=7375 RepID=UPI001F051809|nr:uncharacterized protein LOC111687252 [Lucilia cuprina]
MSSDESNSTELLTSSQKSKRTYKSRMIPLESGQRCIASAMARIIKHMVSKELQERCKDLLQMEDMAETEARILHVLQQIDKEREEAEKEKGNKRKRIKKTFG